MERTKYKKYKMKDGRLILEKENDMNTKLTENTEPIEDRSALLENSLIGDNAKVEDNYLQLNVGDSSIIKIE